MVTEDDSWAEEELERQLAALTPIDCIEDAQNKLFNDFRPIEEEPTIHNQNEEEEGLPPSVELFINKLQEQVAILDKELFECQNLIQYQTGSTEYVEELEDNYFDEVEEERDELKDESQEDWIKHVVQESGDDEGYDNDLVKVFNMTAKYSKQITPDINGVEDSNTENCYDKSKEEQNKFQEDKSDEKRRVTMEKEKRTKQLMNLEEEREKIEQFQKAQMRKLEEEVRLAEANLLKEVQEHEIKLKEMEDQKRKDMELYEKERVRTEMMLEKRNNEAAVRIQAHFKGMRTRNKYGKIIEERMAKKREEILKEQLAKYERIIEEERAALEKEIRDKEEETLRIEAENKRKDDRERELKQRHSEKEKLRLEQERKEKSAWLAKEVKKREEEEDRLRAETERKPHWNKSVQFGMDNAKKVEYGGDENIPKQIEKDDKSECSTELMISPTTSLIRDSQISVINSLTTTDEDTHLETSDQILIDDTFLMMNCIQTTMSGCLDYVVDQVDRARVEDQVDRAWEEDQVDNNRAREEENENFIHGRDNLNIKGAGGRIEHDNNRNVKDMSKGIKISLNSETRHSDCTNVAYPEVSKPKPSLAKPSPEDSKPSMLSSLASKAKNFFKSTRTEEHVVEESQTILSELNKDCDDAEVNNEDINNFSQNASNSRCSPKVSKKSTSPTPRSLTVSKLRKDLDVARSFNSSKSPIKPSHAVTSLTTQSLELDEETRRKNRKTASNNARSEYRRRRKIRESTQLPVNSTPLIAPSLASTTLTSPTSSIVVITPVPPSTSATLMFPPSNSPPKSYTAKKIEVEWNIFNKTVEDQHSAWRTEGKVWKQDPAPPRPATAHIPSNDYVVWRGDVLNRQLHIEDTRDFRVESIVCDVVNVKRCEKFVVNNTDNKRLNIEDCKQMALCLSNCSLQELRVVKGDLITVPKLCTNLVTLDLSYNSITRIDPTPCKNLTSLTLSHNKLRSTRGLSSLPNLITLDLSYNCITNPQGIGNCSILRDLNLSNNQLAQPPLLDNHLLLAVLNLSSNGFTDIISLESSWLPSLTELDISSNGLVTLPSLYKMCPFLSSLNVSNNMLDDVILGVEFLVLERLQYTGNDIDETKMTEYLENCPKERSELCLFGQLCLAQRKARKHFTQNQSDYTTVEQQRGQLAASLKHRTQLVTYNLDQYLMLGLTEEMFCAFTECQMPVKEDVPTVEDPVPDIHSESEVKESDIIQEERHNATQKDRHNSTQEEHRNIKSESVKPLSTIKSEFPSIIQLQCLVRGHLARLSFHQELEGRRAMFVRMFSAANVIQNVWRGYAVRKLLWPWLPWLHRRIQRKQIEHIAAVKIQSVYKGYILRKRLAYLMEQTQYELNDIEFGEEDLDLEFDEDALERGWGLAPTPQLPKNNTPLPNTSIPTTPTPKTPDTPCVPLTTPVPLLPIRRSSASILSEISLISLPPSLTRSKPPSSRSNNSTRSPSIATNRGEMTQHKADIAAEWGMKDNHTVDMLMRRSRRFGDKISADKKREILRNKILSMRLRVPLQRTPPPPSASHSQLNIGEEDVQYEWTMKPIQHARKLVNDSQTQKESIHLQIYRGPLSNTNNVKLPPLSRDKKKSNVP